MDSMFSLPVIQDAPIDRGTDQIVEVTFKGNRRGYFTAADDALKPGDHVIVEAERGQDLGRVRTVGGIAAKKCTSCASDKETDADGKPILAVVRRADAHETQKLIALRLDEERVRRKARELVEQQKLRMKVTEAEWQWDRNKLTLYFTAERRVDFRQLVRDLARTFRTRIELRQIGVRDEAALLGGVGRCGRELCCSTWLREIKPVSLQLAKDQNLSLNPAQISGTCGRLMCCLTYEHDAYLTARKRFPREGKTVKTPHGPERVIGIDIWHDQVTLLSEAKQRRVVKLDALRAEMAAVQEAESQATAMEAGTGRQRRNPRRRTGDAASDGTTDSALEGESDSLHPQSEING
jgi:cell fate regulator YaaT (PSP1 superfamily)